MKLSILIAICTGAVSCVSSGTWLQQSCRDFIWANIDMA
jgi:hypothetical protein